MAQEWWDNEQECKEFTQETFGALEQIDKSVCSFTSQAFELLLHSKDDESIERIIAACEKWGVELLRSAHHLQHRKAWCNNEGYRTPNIYVQEVGPHRLIK